VRMWSRLQVASVIAALGLVLASGPALAITNGSYDGNDHPNVGIMYLRDQPAFAFCSGSLLAPDEFLTAGHCTAGLDALGLGPADVYVSFAERLDLSAEGVLSSAHPIAVTGWTTHPAFGFTNGGGIYRNDVGVIHLASEVAGVTQVDLPAAGFLDDLASKGGLRDDAFVNVGYGWNSVDRSVSSPMANITWEHRRMVSESTVVSLTADHLRLFNGVCAGDSGGPHFYGGAASNLVVSTTSTGSATCTVSATQRLDTRAVLDFLGQYR